MKKRIFSTLIAFIMSAGVLVAGVACSTPANANDPTIGEAAPSFTVVDTDGNEHSLSDFSGQYVVLEWSNFGCPFVQKHYNSGNMQSLQEQWTEEGVVWLSVISSAPGKQGHYPADEMNEQFASREASPTAIIMDESGEMGRAYGARTSPHMFVISPEGNVVYMGAIDDKPTTDLEDVDSAVNYVSEALESHMAGESVEVTATQPYGCNVKY